MRSASSAYGLISGEPQSVPRGWASSDRWASGPLLTSTSKALRLFCFPFAGGGGSAFSSWQSANAATVEIHPIRYPGRETRWGESGFATINDLVAAMAADLRPVLEGPYAFFGHSFGALIAFELARAQAASGGTLPVRLFVSGARAPQLPLREEIHALPESEFLMKLKEYNGIPAELLSNTEVLSVLLPIVREDFRLFETHRYEERGPLPVPISAFGGLSDHHVRVADVLPWGSLTSKSFRSRFLKGGHFFAFDARDAVISHIAEDAGASLDSRHD